MKAATKSAPACKNGKSARHAPASMLLHFFMFVLACAFTFILEHSVEHSFHNAQGDSSPLTSSVFSLSGIYLNLVTSGPRKPIAKFTVIIDDDPNQDSLYFSLASNTLDLCPQRRALATLIEKVTSLQPAVIVIDRSFHSHQCATSSSETAALQAAVEKATANVPVVIGRRKQDDGTISPGLSFKSARQSRLRDGLMEIDPDTRKLPLNFAVQKIAEQSEYQWIDTLSMAAAKAYDQHLIEKTSRLQNLMLGSHDYPLDATNPYTSFIAPKLLTVLHPSDILCLGKAQDQQCRGRGRADVAEDVRAKIVIISRTHTDDRHESVLGLVPGFVLQANYIESLLDQRYYFPATPADYVLGFLIYASIVFGAHLQSVFKTLAWWALTLGAAYVSIVFIVMHLGYYVNPSSISVLAIVFNLGHVLISRVRGLGGHHDVTT